MTQKRVRMRCPACGLKVKGKPRQFEIPRKCPRCGSVCMFTFEQGKKNGAVKSKKVKHMPAVPAGSLENKPLAQQCESRHRLEKVWYLGAVKEQPIGPMSEVEIQELFCQGQVSDVHVAWRKGMKDWKPIKDIPELCSIFTSASPAGISAEPQTYTDVSWYRRDSINRFLSGAGFALFFLIDPILAIPCFLFVCAVIISGGIYRNKLNESGELEKWNWSWRLGPIVGLILSILRLLVL